MDTSEKENELYIGINKFAEEEFGETTFRKIFRITFRHNSHQGIEELGQLAQNQELVFAILEADNAYLVCTENRGVLRGSALLVGKRDVISIVYFSE